MMKFRCGADGTIIGQPDGSLQIHGAGFRYQRYPDDEHDTEETTAVEWEGSSMGGVRRGQIIWQTDACAVSEGGVKEASHSSEGAPGGHREQVPQAAEGHDEDSSGQLQGQGRVSATETSGPGAHHNGNPGE